MSSVMSMSEGAIHYSSYSEPASLRRHHTAEEPVIVDLQDEQFPSGNELGEEEDSDSEHEDAVIENQTSRITSNDSCSNAIDGVQYSRELLVFYLYGKIKPRHGMQSI